MTDIDERPTIGERYTIAADGTYITDEQALIAAGWSQSKLGVMLMRLRGEFDSVKAELHGAGPLNMTEALLILSHLKTLRETREAFAALAIQRATIEKFMEPDTIAARIAGHVLVAFLDPKCHACDGVGTTGGYGAPQLVCRACRGSTLAMAKIGQDEGQRRFAKHMQSLAEHAVSAAERSIGSRLQAAKAARAHVTDALDAATCSA